jgi:hypothetical protein
VHQFKKPTAKTANLVFAETQTSVKKPKEFFLSTLGQTDEKNKLYLKIGKLKEFK